MIILLIGIGAILFVLGIWFLYRGYVSTPNANQVVLLSEYNKLTGYLALSKDAEKKLRLDLDAIRQELLAAKNVAERAKKDEEEYRLKISHLEEEMRTVNQKAESQAKDALELVNALQAEAEQLKNTRDLTLVRDHESAIALANEEIKNENEFLRRDLEQNVSRVRELEEALNVIRTSTQEQTQQQLIELNSVINNLKGENESVTLQLKKASARCLQLEQSWATMSEAKRLLDEKISQATGAIETFFQENENLKKEINFHLQRIHELEAGRANASSLERFKEDNETLKERLNEHLGRIQELEEEVVSVKREKERQLMQYQSAAERLKLENQNLSAQIEQKSFSQRQVEDNILSLRRDYERQLAQSAAMVDSLKFSQSALQEQLRDSFNKIHMLEESMDNLQKDQTRQVVQANAVVEQITIEKKSLRTQLEQGLAQIHQLENDLRSALREKDERLAEVTSEKERLKFSLQSLKVQAEEKVVQVERLKGDVASLSRERDEYTLKTKSTIDALREDRETFLETKSELEENLRKLKEANAQLIEQEKYIQYELAKSRAQSMGMERICKDFKIQLDSLQKETESLKSQNKALNKYKEDTEKTFKELKEHNDHLVKKEKLSRIELEKSREQLVGLEKIFEDFKSRLQGSKP